MMRSQIGTSAQRRTRPPDVLAPSAATASSTHPATVATGRGSRQAAARLRGAAGRRSLIAGRTRATVADELAGRVAGVGWAR